jgi:hypothetical protein
MITNLKALLINTQQQYRDILEKVNSIKNKNTKLELNKVIQVILMINN